MLVVPEQESILILPPRTGSTSLHHAIRETFPQSFLLYRHAERDAIPPGYESYSVVGFVRHPLPRMWSLYKFICSLDPMGSAKWAQEEVMRLLESVQGKTFEDWLLHNDRPFLPSDTVHPGLYQLRHTPENKRSQADYLLPDRGTTIIPFTELVPFMRHFGLPELHLNESTHRIPMRVPTREVQNHLETFMGWELALGLEPV